jgi:hypothetical protein
MRQRGRSDAQESREQERERSDGSGYTASTAALRAPLKQHINSQVTGPSVGDIGPIGLIRDPTPSCVLVVRCCSCFRNGVLQAKAQGLLAPSLLNEMVAVRKNRACGVSMIQRRSSLKAQGAAETGCAKVLAELFVLGPVRKEIPDLQPKRYAQLRSRSQFCLTKCAPPVLVLSRARRSVSSKQHLSPYPAPRVRRR